MGRSLAVYAAAWGKRYNRRDSDEMERFDRKIRHGQPDEISNETMMEARFVARYGTTRIIGEFSSKGRDNYPRNCQVLVRSDRGVEVGEVLSLASDRTREYLGSTEAKGHILREATEQDRQKIDELRVQEREEFLGCQAMIAEHKLQMQLVDVEHLFGGER